MGNAFRRGSLAVVVAVTGWLLWQPAAQAHPLLVGRWVTNVPVGGQTAYEFGPGVYLDNGVWQGPYTYFVAGCPVMTGRYELRVYVGTVGVLGFREGQGGATSVGVMDLVTRELTFRNLLYKPAAQ
jgi:hypothetical protein